MFLKEVLEHEMCCFLTIKQLAGTNFHIFFHLIANTKPATPPKPTGHFLTNFGQMEQQQQQQKQKMCLTAWNPRFKSGIPMKHGRFGDLPTSRQ